MGLYVVVSVKMAFSPVVLASLVVLLKKEMWNFKNEKCSGSISVPSELVIWYTWGTEKPQSILRDWESLE